MSTTGRLRLFNLPIDPLPMSETVSAIERALDQRRPGAHVGLNAANVVSARADAAYARDMEAADLVGADGQPVVWVGRLFGLPIPERVTGIDLMLELLDRALSRGWRIYLVGGRPEVVAETARRIEGRGISVAGFRDGYFSAEDDAAVAARVVASGADILFVGMPSPRKEQFIIRAARPAGIGYSIAVGGAFDVLAGRVRRAPGVLQRIGLEWAFRIVQEPRRLLGRYAISNTRFVALVARELIGNRIRRRRRS